LELILSIHSTSRNFHPNISSTSIYHPKNIDVQLSSKYFTHFVIFIHVHVVSIRHKCFGISFIHTFQLVKNFIQTICLLAFTIQKVHWCSPSSKLLIHFVSFIHVHVTKYFPCHSYMAWGYSKNILSLSS
jgi:hypothetical protein